MRLLILGRGKTGNVIAEVARERGHSVTVLGSSDNPSGSALTQKLLADIDAVIDFTTPDAVAGNLQALLPLGARVVVGTTGWYASLEQLSTLATQHDASLLHGTNFSLGVQAFFRAARELARALPGYDIAIEETHHVTKKDAPSGTALTLQRAVRRGTEDAGHPLPAHQPPITAHRIGEAAGLHVLTLSSPEETLTLRHEAFSRRGFATGAVRAAEWLAAQPKAGIYDFAEVAPQL